MAEVNTSCSYWSRPIVCVLRQNDWSIYPMLVYRDKIAKLGSRIATKWLAHLSDASVLWQMAEVNTSCSHWIRPFVCVLWQNDWSQVHSRFAVKLNRKCFVTKRLKLVRLTVTELDQLCVYCNKTTDMLSVVWPERIVTKWLKLGSRIAKKTTDMSSIRLSDAGVSWQNSWS